MELAVVPVQGKNAMKHKSLFILFVLLISAITAEARAWKWIGPGAGTIDQLVPDRSHPATWYAVSTGSLYHSKDGGNTWLPANIPNVLAIAVQPSTSNVLVSTRGASPESSRILLSRDLGGSFTEIGAVNFTLRKIVVNPADPSLVLGFGSGSFDLTQSTDGGRHWTQVSTLPLVPGQPFEDLQGCVTTGYAFNDVMISPLDGRTIYASTGVNFSCGSGEGGCETLLLASGNNGRSWQIVDREEPADDCGNPSHFHVDPLYKRAFLFNTDGIQALTSTGFAPISSVQVSELASVPRKPNVLLALQKTAAHANLLTSKDTGRTWAKIQSNLFDSISRIATLDSSAGGLFAGTDGAGLYFRDDLQAWRQANTGFRESRVVSIGSDGQPEHVMGVTADESGYYARYLFSTNNGGESWQNLSFQLPAYSAIKGTGIIAINPNNPGNLILSGGNGANEVRVSKDGGKSWQLAGKNLFFRTFDPGNANAVYYAANGKVYRSTQEGLFPQVLPLQLDSLYINRIVMDANNHNTMFFLTEKGVYRSNDGGKTARLMNAGLKATCSFCDLDPRDMTALPQANSFLLALSSGNVYRTVNSGNTWEKLSHVNGFAKRILAADNLGMHFFLLTGKLYESLDGGKTWKNVSNEIAGAPAVNDMTDPRIQPIYLATNRGVFVQR